MASNFDFSAGIVSPPILDRIQRGGRTRDDLPRRRGHVRNRPDRKGSGDESPEDIKTADEDETEQHRLDLRA